MFTVQQVTPEKIFANKQKLEKWLPNQFKSALDGQVWIDDFKVIAQRFQLMKFLDKSKKEMVSCQWDTELIERLVLETLQNVATYIPLQNTIVTVVPALPFKQFNIKDQGLWSNAFTNGPNNIIVAIPPEPNFEFLQQLIAHEAHHACELNPLYKLKKEEITLADWLKLEGTAEFFSLSLYLDHRWWKNSLTKDVDLKLTNLAKSNYTSTDPKLINPINFGDPESGIPYLAGYALAYEMTKQYVASNPVSKWVDLFQIDPSKLVLNYQPELESGITMEIRRVQVQHAEQYLELRLEALQNAPQAFAASYEDEKDDRIEKYKNRFSSQDSFTYGAFDREKLIGVVSLVPNNRAKLQHKADIFAMYVTPNYRGIGVGSQLVRKAIEQAKSLPLIEQVLLTVVETNVPAKKLYSSLGFVPFGLEKNAMKVYGEYVDEEYMVLFLES